MKTAVVIGAGHNGLTAACYLARAGFQVTVLEASDRVGGMAATAPLVATAPHHLLSPCAIDAVYWNASTVAQDLELAKHGLRTIDHDPAWAWVGGDGETLVLQRDIGKTIADIRKFSDQDARTYAEMVDVAMKVLAIQDGYGVADALRPGWKVLAGSAAKLRDKNTRRMLGRLATSSAAEVIDEMFVSDAVRGVFASMASILGAITVDGSAIGMLATAPLHRYGVVRPVGGMQAIPTALVRSLDESGGVVRLRSAVEAILVREGLCVGVVVGGREMRSDVVVSAVPPHVTARLLHGADVPSLASLRRAPANAAGLGCFTINVALESQVQLPRHMRPDVDMRRPTLFFGTLEQVVEAELECRQGRLPMAPPWTATLLSATDPSLAPPGGDVLYLYGPSPVDARGGWEGARKEYEERLLQAVGVVLEGVEAAEIGRFSESPRDLESRLGAENGCIYHVDQAVTRLGPLRPAHGWGGHRTPVPGLFLSGAGTHPGGGVSGIPGQLAARAVLTP